MKSAFIVLALGAALITGCTFAMRTNVAKLDQISRPAKTGEVEAFMQGKRPVRSYKEIALYTLASHGEYEAKAIGGFLKLARKHGADAVLIDRVATVRAERGGKIVDADARMEGGGVAAVVNPLAACVFRATAIVWTDQK